MVPYIIADDKIPFLKGVLEPFADIHYLPGNAIGHPDVSRARALLVRTRTLCNEQLLHETPVTFIGSATIGYDHIDTRYCETHQIRWTNAPGCNAASVTQYIASALFTLARRHGFQLKNKVLGIVGAGHVGSKVEQLARAIGMQVLLNDPPRARVEGPQKFVGLETLLGESDMVTLHVPLTLQGVDRSYHLIGPRQIHRMNPRAWLINTSRGPVVDQKALTVALQEKKIAGAVLDVWENEPALDAGLLPLTDIATPHIAGYSADGKANATAIVVRALALHFGLPLSEWYPPQVPLPGETLFRIDGRLKTTEEMVGEAVIKSYDIREDDARLRSDPAGFEQQRETYPLRREFPVFEARLTNCRPDGIEILNNLGFKTTAI